MFHQVGKDILDTKSKSFCGAKWYNATTWLGSGTTASCHHPPAHKIPLEEITVDPSAIHNTKHKKAMRKMMQRGERPRECEYCWKVEDMETDAVSDRVYKSIIYTEDDLKKAHEMDYNESVDLKTFEISFDLFTAAMIPFSKELSIFEDLKLFNPASVVPFLDATADINSSSAMLQAKALLENMDLGQGFNVK